MRSTDRIEKADEHTVDIVTRHPDPTLLFNLGSFWITDDDWLAKHDAFTAHEGVGATTYAHSNVNGTGPFILEEWAPDVRTVLVPNPAWWARPEHNLTRVIYTPIPVDGTRVAALVAGDVDLIFLAV